MPGNGLSQRCHIEFVCFKTCDSGELYSITAQSMMYYDIFATCEFLRRVKLDSFDFKVLDHFKEELRELLSAMPSYFSEIKTVS